MIFEHKGHIQDFLWELESHLEREDAAFVEYTIELLEEFSSRIINTLESGGLVSGNELETASDCLSWRHVLRSYDSAYAMLTALYHLKMLASDLRLTGSGFSFSPRDTWPWPPERVQEAIDALRPAFVEVLAQEALEALYPLQEQAEKLRAARRKGGKKSHAFPLDLVLYHLLKRAPGTKVKDLWARFVRGEEFHFSNGSKITFGAGGADDDQIYLHDSATGETIHVTFKALETHVTKMRKEIAKVPRK